MANSQHDANKVLRVLEGKRLKYTVRVYREKEVIEVQSDHIPKIKFDPEARTLMLFCALNVYDSNSEYPLMIWQEKDTMTCEQNPEPDKQAS